MTPLPSLTLLAPIVLLAVAAFAATRPNSRPGVLPRLAEGGALAALGLALSGVGQLLIHGASTLSLGFGAALLAFRLDIFVN